MTLSVGYGPNRGFKLAVPEIPHRINLLYIKTITEKFKENSLLMPPEQANLGMEKAKKARKRQIDCESKMVIFKREVNKQLKTRSCFSE